LWLCVTHCPIHHVGSAIIFLGQNFKKHIVEKMELFILLVYASYAIQRKKEMCFRKPFAQGF